MSRFLWSILGLAVCLTLPNAASATIFRGCKGSLQVVITQYKGSFNHAKAIGILDNFDAGGSCKNKLHANECRENAKNYVFRCGKAYWAKRGTKSLPTECKGARGGVGVKGVGPFRRSPKTHSNYDLNYTIEYAACCQLQPKADELTLNVQAVSHGDKGCGRNRNVGSVGSGKFMETYVMARGYRANCKRLRSMGWCS